MKSKSTVKLLLILFVLFLFSYSLFTGIGFAVFTFMLYPTYVLWIVLLGMICLLPFYNPFKEFSWLSWIIVSVYILPVSFIDSLLSEGVVLTLPVIAFFVYWSQFIEKGFKDIQANTMKMLTANYDMFLISLSIFLPTLISFIFERNNVYVRGWWSWWPIITYIISFYGIVYGCIFSLVNVVFLKIPHKRYTQAFSVITVFSWSMLPLVSKPLRDMKIDPAIFTLSLLIVIHTILAGTYFLTDKNHNVKNQ